MPWAALRKPHSDVDFGKIFFGLITRHIPGEAADVGDGDSGIEYWTQVWLWPHPHARDCSGPTLLFPNLERFVQQLSQDAEFYAPMVTRAQPLCPPLAAILHTDPRQTATHYRQEKSPPSTAGGSFTFLIKIFTVTLLPPFSGQEQLRRCFLKMDGKRTNVWMKSWDYSHRFTWMVGKKQNICRQKTTSKVQRHS